MRTVIWSAKAERQLEAWIDHLGRAAGEEIAQRAHAEVRSEAEALSHFSGHRRSWWEDYQHVSLKDWHKLLVYRVDGELVRIAALYDMRQDLTRVRP